MHVIMAAEALWTLDRVSLGAGRLREVSVEIPRGIAAVVGWSGAGKTSLLNVLVGFERPDRGVIAAPGSVAWVPQDGGLWPHCTAREHLEIAGAAADAADALLAAFDLGERAAARPGELSQGEQARLNVARALAARAAVLVMDEPLAHVDPARVARYWAALREHLGARSLVFATHSPEAALGHAEHVICLRNGCLLHAGPMGETYAHPPNPEVMECLGPGNWVTPDEAALWFGEKLREPRCFRPEQIEIEPAHISHVVVTATTFLGSVAETELRLVNAAAIRKFLHRPSGPHLHAGAPASLRLQE
jgi:ABC-type Fe3+/spermidine/putrescine transport system ATPase subunit